MMSIRRVFLSSTAKDLATHREAVYRAIEGLDGYHCERMEELVVYLQHAANSAT